MTKLERIIDILRQKGYITYHFPDERDLYVYPAYYLDVKKVKQPVIEWKIKKDLRSLTWFLKQRKLDKKGAKDE